MSTAGWVLLVFGSLVGLAIGSFTCVIIDRLPLRLDEPNEYGDLYDTRPWREVLGGSSRCSSCGEPVRARDNIPVLSWLLLGGRCRGCGEPIPAFHPFVELAVPLVGLAMYWGIGWNWLLLPALLLVPVGVAVAVIDLRTLIVPTRLIWPAFAVQIAASLVVVAIDGEPSWLLGGVVGIATLCGPLFALWWIHPKGMGFGDIRLTVLLGWAVGFAVCAASGGGLVLVVLAAAGTLAAAAALGIVLALVTAGSMGRQVPFGPSLVTAALVIIAVAEPFVQPFLT